MAKPGWLYFDLTEWIVSTDMTDNEKQDHPSHATTGGYLRGYEYKAAWRRAFDAASEDDRKKVLDLPNFDADIFLEITGIDVRLEFAEKPASCDGKIVEIDGKQYKLTAVEGGKDDDY